MPVPNQKTMKRAPGGKSRIKLDGGYLFAAAISLTGAALVFLLLNWAFCLPRARTLSLDGFPLPKLPVRESRPPSLAVGLEIDYPVECRRRSIEGIVLLEVAVDAAGRVTGVEVVRGAHRKLDEAAKLAAGQASFRPALSCGEAVAAKVRLPVRFSLSDDGSEE